MRILPVILSGGYGSRLWPLSRKQYPKQYLPITEEDSMLQVTIKRLHGLGEVGEPIVVCNVDHRFIVAEQLHQIGVRNPTIILEPESKNTAPAIALAAFYALNNIKDKDVVLLILSADHIIENSKSFYRAVDVGCKQAVDEKIVTFGVFPKNPNTGYGYIKGEVCDESSALYRVNDFVEKPSLLDANKYIEDGTYFWNSGIFMFQAKVLIQELAKYSKEIVDAAQQSINESVSDLDFVRVGCSAFKKSPSDSIDYALMEKTDKAMMVAFDAKWSDVGSWKALYEIGKHDENGNVLKGGKVITEGVKNSYIHADHHMVVAIGVDDLVIVDTADATLVAAKDKAVDVKVIVNHLERENHEEHSVHRKVFRPWGWYDSVDFGERFHVKRILVKPGGSLSLQKHNFRAEHWIVVSGSAKVINNEKEFILRTNESTYIPIGHKHRLENIEESPLEIIEVQSGSYFGEDDIERFDDYYGRHSELSSEDNTE